MTDSLELDIEQFVSSCKQRGVSNWRGISIGTSIGQVRAENQDRVAYVRSENSRVKELNYDLVLLADGMGGLSNGGQAADVAIGSFVAKFHEQAKSLLEERLVKAAHAANESVFKRLQGKGGTTLAAVVIDSDSNMFALSVGDSRVYLATDANELVQVSRDDTIGEVLKAKSNDIDPYFDQRLVQFIGMGEGVEPHVYKLVRGGSKFFLLTSDGVHGVGNIVLSRLINMRGEKSGLVESLLATANAFGGSDNASAIQVSLQDLDPIERGRDRLTVHANHGALVCRYMPPDEARVADVKQADVATANQRKSADENQIIAPPSAVKKVAKKKAKKKKPVAAKGPGELKFYFPGGDK